MVIPIVMHAAQHPPSEPQVHVSAVDSFWTYLSVKVVPSSRLLSSSSNCCTGGSS